MLRLGVVGMGFGRAVVLPALAGMDGVTVTALADSGSGRAAEAATGLLGDFRLFDDGRALACSDAVDAVIVCCPPAAQAAIVEAALGAGKHVLCEKPVGLDADTGRLAALARSAGRIAAVGFEMRYEPGIAALKDLVQRGRLGAPRRILVTWITSGGGDPQRPFSWRHDRALGGGMLSEFASHVLDYLGWIAGPFAVTAARLETVVATRPGADGALHPVTGEDGCDLLLAFEGGATGHVAVTNTAGRALGHRIEIIGDRAAATWLLRPPFTASHATLTLDDAAGSTSIPLGDGDDDSRVQSYRALLRDFTAAIDGHHVERLPGFAAAVTVSQARVAARALGAPCH